MGKNILYFVLATAVIVAVAGVGIFIVQQRASQEPEEPERSSQRVQPAEQESGLGSELNQNPGSKVPETNPLEGYRNPFE